MLADNRKNIRKVRKMNNNQPDILVVLAVVLGLGILVSSITWGSNESRRTAQATSTLETPRLGISQR